MSTPHTSPLRNTGALISAVRFSLTIVGSVMPVVSSMTNRPPDNADADLRLADAADGDALPSLLADPDGSGEPDRGRIVLVDEAQRDDFGADQLARAGDDLGQQRLEIGAIDDRTLDLREPFEQLLAAAQRRDELERAHRLCQRYGHSAQQHALLGGERPVRAGELQRRGLVDRRVDQAQARALAVADGGEHRTVLVDDRARVRGERLGSSLHTRLQRAWDVLARPKQRQVLGQLIDANVL